MRRWMLRGGGEVMGVRRGAGGGGGGGLGAFCQAQHGIGS